MLVSNNLVCSACGYALRGLDADGECPECGQRIPRSIAKSQRGPGPVFIFLKILFLIVIAVLCFVVPTIWGAINAEYGNRGPNGEYLVNVNHVAIYSAIFSLITTAVLAYLLLRKR